MTPAAARRLEELELLAKSSRALNSTLDLDQLLKVILKIVRDGFDVETASILKLDPSGEKMVFEMARGSRGRDIVGLEVPIGEGVVGWVAKHQRPAIVNDLQNDRRYSARLHKELGLKTHSIMSIPLKRRQRLVGVIEVVNRRNGAPFTDDDLNLFMALGDHIATAMENARLFDEAERSRLENELLYEISVALGKSLTLDEVLEQILKNLGRLIPYDAAAIFVLDRKQHELVSHIQRGYDPGREKQLRLKLDEGIVGWSAQHKQGVIVADTSKDKRYVSARRRTRSEIVAPMLSRGAVIGLFNLESDRVDAYRGKDLTLLQSFAAQAGVSIERAQLLEEQRTKRQIERELKLARTVQDFFIPRKSHRLGGYTLTGRSYPSLELSGDYFDVYPLARPHMAFAIADVAGKGVPASIIMSSFRATLHTAAPYFTNARDIAQRANEILLETVRPYDFVTAFIGVLNTETGEVSYCCAGHEPGILMAPNGRYRLLDTGGPVLGVFDDIPLEEGRFRLQDETLLLYTDGTVDVTNSKDQPFGTKRLVKVLKENRRLNPSQLCQAIRRCLVDFIGDTPQLDDTTFLILKK